MDKLLDLLGGDKFKSIVLAWFVPTLLFVLLFALVVGPELHGSWLARQFATATGRLALNRGLAVVILSALVAIAGYILRDDIYRVLEGYSWPDFLENWRRNRAHVPEARYVRALRDYLRANANGETTEKYVFSLVEARGYRHRRGRTKQRKLRRKRPLFVPRDKGYDTVDEQDLPKYVPEDKYVAATNFGNRMAVAESFGYEAYGLDAQKFWYDLVDVTSATGLASIAEARDKLDALVASTVLSYAFLAGDVGAFVWALINRRGLLAISVAGGLAWAAGIVSYHLSFRAIDEYSDAIATLANTGRLALAQKHRVRLPEAIEDERAMWKALAGTLYYPGSSKYEEELAPFRTTAAGAGPRPGDGAEVGSGG